MKKIGILGSGAVGTALATGLKNKGYDIMIGTRTPSKLEDWALRDGEGIKIGDFSQAAKYGDLLILAVKGKAADSAIETAEPANFKGKTVIDVTNPISDEKSVDGVLKFFTNLNESLMEKLQKKFPEAHFVKAFNSIGAPHMIDPDFGQKPTMFICGNSENAKSEVREILETSGWHVADMGTAVAARAIEPLCILWCIPGIREGNWNHAFKQLIKE